MNVCASCTLWCTVSLLTLGSEKLVQALLQLRPEEQREVDNTGNSSTELGRTPELERRARWEKHYSGLSEGEEYKSHSLVMALSSGAVMVTVHTHYHVAALQHTDGRTEEPLEQGILSGRTLTLPQLP
nr:uncharacterized protein LOC129527793 [Gorilla gorilla gorilla]